MKVGYYSHSKKMWINSLLDLGDVWNSISRGRSLRFGFWIPLLLNLRNANMIAVKTTKVNSVHLRTVSSQILYENDTFSTTNKAN